VTLRLLLSKELKSLLREPMVIAMIVLPLVMYSAMAPFYGAASKQAEAAAKLKGVKLAVAACHPRAMEKAMLETIASSLRARGVNASYVEACSPLRLLEHGYDVVVMLNSTAATKVSFTVYVKGSVSKLMKTLALPGSVIGQIRVAASPAANVTSRAYIVLNGRLWSFEDLNNLYGVGITMGYATFFILFPAASLGAALIGAEREERTLDVLFSLPVSRRSIAVSKALAALSVSVLAAVSALAGLYNMFHSMGVNLGITRYYAPGDLGVYVAAIAAEALFAVMLAMIVGLFASTMRGAQSASMIVVFPAIVPPMMLMVGLPLSLWVAVLPYTAAVYAGLSPILGTRMALAATAAQALEALAALLVLAKLLESEAAVTGPETVKRLLQRLRRRRR